MLGCSENELYETYLEPCFLADNNSFYILKNEVLETSTGDILYNWLLENCDFKGNIIKSSVLNYVENNYNNRPIDLLILNDSIIYIAGDRESYYNDIGYHFYKDTDVIDFKTGYDFYVDSYYGDSVNIVKKNMLTGQKDTLLKVQNSSYYSQWNVANFSYNCNRSNIIVFNSNVVILINDDDGNIKNSKTFSLEGSSAFLYDDSTLVTSEEGTLIFSRIFLDTCYSIDTWEITDKKIVDFTINNDIVIYERVDNENTYNYDKCDEIAIYYRNTKKDEVLFTNNNYYYDDD